MSSTVQQKGSPPAAGGFARKASGLVRDFSQLDAWIYNVLAINIVVNVALSYALVSVTYPGASLWLAFVIAGVMCTFEAVVYAFFTTAMPRSGGDYVFQSRVLGGGVATLFAFTAVTISQMVWMALAGWLAANLLFSPFLLLLGAQYDVAWMRDAGSWFTKDIAVFICAVACIAWGAFVNIRGLRVYALLQRWFFWVGAAALLIVVIAMLLASHDDFVNNLNGFMEDGFGVSNAYQATVEAGGSADFSFSLGDTILASVIASFALIYPAWGVMQAGEIKRANSLSSNMRAIVGAEVFAFVTVAIISALLVSRVGNEFLFASGSLFYGGSEDALPVPPFFGFFAALMSSSPILIWIAFVMFIAWFVMWFPNITLGGTRVMIAMAFDRVLPEVVGRVNRRTHTPIVAIAIFSVGCLIASVLYSFLDSFVSLTLGLLILNITGFAATMAAAVVFPYRKKDMYASTPAARYKIAGIPAMSVAAVIFLAFVVFVDVQALRADELALNGRDGLLFIFGCYAISALIYVGSKIYRRRKEGLDLGMVYRELPSE